VRAELSPDEAAELERYEALVSYVDREIVRLTPRRRDSAGKVAAALAFNAALGDPQQRYPSIQVAGTSGKGSVSALLSEALLSAGVRVGLHVSPYLQSFSEKTWIAGRLASPSQLWSALEHVRPETERVRHDPQLPASVHGLTSLAISYQAFADAGVELAVMETGCGGRFDLVQGLRKALCVISDLALDHQQALGETLPEIAWHKAGILEAGVPAVALKGPGKDVVAAEAELVGAPLDLVSLEDLAPEPRVLVFPTLGRVEFPEPLSGFRQRNLALAGLGLDALARAGWELRGEHLLAAAAAPPLPGRLEEVQSSPRVVLDGAHNPHKLEGCLRALVGEPGRGPRLHVLLGASGLRAPEDLVAALVPWRPRVTTTRLELYGKRTVPADELAQVARAQGLEAQALEPPEAALEAALAALPEGETLLVTGSIYLVGRLRERWVPRSAVILGGSTNPPRGNA
jgi:dihydrofolate synthase / folylpolyglutamate synthase